MEKRLSMQQFLRENQDELDQAIRRLLGRPDATLTDKERELWVRNTEALYQWARREGVPV
jgi:hypothetical protein